MASDWFTTLVGFEEEGYDATRSRLLVEGDELVSTVNDERYGIGSLTVPTLAELRSRIEVPAGGRSKVRCVTGDARAMHAEPELEGALFQVASQFNLLEMPGPSVTPEHGVTSYAGDPTQGPACAMAAGAATIYRNYFAPVDGESGQTRARQIDALSAVASWAHLVDHSECLGGEFVPNTALRVDERRVSVVRLGPPVLFRWCGL
ncbi:MAG: hypothetical protein JWR34_2158 [Mycobacterium sp.]|nr:hypothetical protein [Mycobacterium sp.]